MRVKICWNVHLSWRRNIATTPTSWNTYFHFVSHIFMNFFQIVFVRIKIDKSKMVFVSEAPLRSWLSTNMSKLWVSGWWWWTLLPYFGLPLPSWKRRAGDFETKAVRREMLFCKYIFKLAKKTCKKFPDPFVTKG